MYNEHADPHNELSCVQDRVSNSTGSQAALDAVELNGNSERNGIAVHQLQQQVE